MEKYVLTMVICGLIKMQFLEYLAEKTLKFFAVESVFCVL